MATLPPSQGNGTEDPFSQDVCHPPKSQSLHAENVSLEHEEKCFPLCPPPSSHGIAEMQYAPRPTKEVARLAPGPKVCVRPEADGNSHLWTLQLPSIHSGMPQNVKGNLSTACFSTPPPSATTSPTFLVAAIHTHTA